MSFDPPPTASPLVPSHHEGGRIAVVDQDGVTLSYGELERRSTDLAGSFADAGVAVHTVVGLPATRTIETVVRLCALWRLGAVPLVLDPDRPDLDAAASGVAMMLVTADGPVPVASSPQYRPGPNDVIWVPTSGSSGASRVVRLTRDNVLAAVNASQRRLDTTADDRWLLVLPLFHVGGLSVLWRSFAAGGTVVLHDRFDTRRVVAAMAGGELTAASLVPTMVARLLESDLLPSSELRFVLVGGAASDPSLLDRAVAAGLPVLATYGATEACSQIATPEPGDALGVPGSVGRPLPGVEVTIVDTDGRPVVHSEIGQIAINGPSVFPGYAGEPSRVGPHLTGDLGRWDGDRLVVVGRSDDIVISGGVNVAPSDVEPVVTTHPDVAVCVMVGSPDPEWGSVVVAVVQPWPGIVVDEAALDAHAAERLAPSHRPRRWIVVDKVPLLPNGKIDRQQIRRLVEVTEGAA